MYCVCFNLMVSAGVQERVRVAAEIHDKVMVASAHTRARAHSLCIFPLILLFFLRWICFDSIGSGSSAYISR